MLTRILVAAAALTVAPAVTASATSHHATCVVWREDITPMGGDNAQPWYGWRVTVGPKTVDSRHRWRNSASAGEAMDRFVDRHPSLHCADL